MFYNIPLDDYGYAVFKELEVSIVILHVYLCSMSSIFLFFNIHIQGWTPLHTASYMGHAKIVRLLLLLGADMDIEDTQVLFYLYRLLIQ